jgi:hypothetical protein
MRRRRGSSPSRDSQPRRRADRSRAGPRGARRARRPRRANGSCGRSRGSARGSPRHRVSRGPLALGRRRRRRGARGRRGEKGGCDASTPIGSQATRHRLQRRGLVAEPRGDAIEGFVIDEDRAKGLVLTLEGLLWLEKEPPGQAAVHNACSRALIIFRPESTVERTAKIGPEKGATRSWAWRWP